MNRKEFITSLFSILAASFLPAGFHRVRGSSIIRPPGSIEENLFSRLCIRCGLCIKSCPAKCLKKIGIEKSVKDWLSPEIIPRQRGCILCQNCGKVCPTGAIKKIEQEKIKIGTARIEKSTCLVWTNSKECLVCLEFCPVGAIYLDQKGRPVVNPEICTGCGLCEENCPVLTREAAIRVTTEGERRYQPEKLSIY